MDVCETCKKCWNFQVCELGCFGGPAPCDSFYDGQTRKEDENEIPS